MGFEPKGSKGEGILAMGLHPHSEIPKDAPASFSILPLLQQWHMNPQKMGQFPVFEEKFFFFFA